MSSTSVGGLSLCRARLRVGLPTLIRTGLVDRYRLLVFPVVLGSGKWPFAGYAIPSALPSALRPVSSTVSGTEVVMGTYEPAGEVATGSFGA